jgi:hypothetical protein
MARILCVFEVLLLVLLAAPPARAADAVVGSGTPGSCTETAFDTAFAAVQGSGGGTLTFNCGGPATIPFSAQKVLQADTVLDGGGQITLSGGGQARLFFVNEGLALTVRAVTLRDGFADVGGGLIETFGGTVRLEDALLMDSRATTTGGAINCSNGTNPGEIVIEDSLLDGHTALNGGAIYSGGCQLTITGSRLVSNRAVPVGDLEGKGGAVYLDTQSQLQVQDTSFDQNQGLVGGALLISRGVIATLTGTTLDRSQATYGGAIHNDGTLSIVQSLLDRSQATGQGGGIYNLSGSVQLEDSTLRRGSAGEWGGGLLSAGGVVDMTGVTVDGNSAGSGGGGGISLAGGAMEITESTISNNVASGPDADGGGIHQASDGDLTMTNVTVANNRAPNGLGGGLYHRSRNATLAYVTFAGNQAATGQDIAEEPLAGASITLEASALDGVGVACAMPPLTLINSNGYNRIRGVCNLVMQATDQVQAGDLGLLPLGNNGGPTQTLLPSGSSQLVDAIPLGDCPPVAAADQRFKLRPSGLGCDIGAVERQPGDRGFFLYLPAVLRNLAQ